MAAGYLLDAVGLAINAAVLGVAALGAGPRGVPAFREEPTAAPAGSLALVASVVACALGYLLWLASPSLLPVTNGPDVVHHLLLIHVIHRTHHLVHDPALGPYLLEMVNYTPGSHIAAAAVAGWLRVDPLRVLLPLTALFVAVKAGIIYVLALRLVPAKPGGVARRSGRAGAPPGSRGVRARVVLPVLLLRAGRVGDLRDGDGPRRPGLDADRRPPLSLAGVGVRRRRVSVVARLDRAGRRGRADGDRGVRPTSLRRSLGGGEGRAHGWIAAAHRGGAGGAAWRSCMRRRTRRGRPSSAAPVR